MAANFPVMSILSLVRSSAVQSSRPVGMEREHWTHMLSQMQSDCPAKRDFPAKLDSLQAHMEHKFRKRVSKNQLLHE